MVARLSFISVLLVFLGGCTILGECLGISGAEVGEQSEKTQAASPPPLKKQSKAETCDCPPPTQPKEDTSGKARDPITKNPGKDRIQRAQALLKVSGTNPGPIDGIMGPRTRAALQRFRSKCERLSELVDGEISSQTISQVAKPATQVSKDPREHEIRKLQTLLKEFGANPGPIDGIRGPKTRTALQTFYSRCTTVNELIGTPDMEIVQEAAMEIQATSALPSDQQTESVISGSPASTEPPLNDEPEGANNLPGENLSREQVRLVQIRLKTSGFDPGPIDGIMGPQTRAALEQELKANGEY